MTTPQTAMDVSRHLGDLSKQLDELTRQLGEADKIATTLKAQYTKLYADTWLGTSGSLESRKQETVLACWDESYAAEMAACEVRDLRARIHSLESRIEVGRTYASTIRTEAALATSSGRPYGV